MARCSKKKKKKKRWGESKRKVRQSIGDGRGRSTKCAARSSRLSLCRSISATFIIAESSLILIVGTIDLFSFSICGRRKELALVRYSWWAMMLCACVPFSPSDDGPIFCVLMNLLSKTFNGLGRGTSGIDIDLRRVDIDQCPPRGGNTQLNIFAASDKCKLRTTKVSLYQLTGLCLEYVWKVR